MSFSLTGVDDEATQRCFAHIHDRVRATLVRGEPVTVAGGRPVRRTLKLLRALARGHWIVGEEYVAACARNRGVAVDPAPFEEGMLPHVPGAQLSRLSGGGRALAGLTVTLRGATVMPHADLCSLCYEAGARVQYGRLISDAGATTQEACAGLREAIHTRKTPPASRTYVALDPAFHRNANQQRFAGGHGNLFASIEKVGSPVTMAKMAEIVPNDGRRWSQEDPR